jgi:hypothetical protein
MYNYNQFYENGDKVQMLSPLNAQSAASTASTWAGNDMDSMSSADSGYWDNSGAMGYMMHADPAAQQGQDQQQRYIVPVPMMPTPFGYMPLAGPGSPMSQGSPMGQGAAVAMPQMASAPAGMAMMPAVAAGMRNSEACSPTNMPMQPVSPTAPTMIMQPTGAVNAESGMQMMQPVAVAMIPAGMPMPGMAGMQTIPMTPPPGYMLKCVNEQTPQNGEQSPAGGEKKVRLLEELLPGGVRRRATREELGRKVFVGGLNPTTTTEDLRSYFSDFGVVTDACVITDSSSKASRGFGFVEFEEKIPEGLLDQQHIIDQRRCGVREYGHSTSSSS